MQIMRDTVGFQILLYRHLCLAISLAWALRKVCRYYICRCYCWVEKSMLRRNCASHILPAGAIWYICELLYINIYIYNFYMYFILSAHQMLSWPRKFFITNNYLIASMFACVYAPEAINN